ncbi:MAG TPA: type III PLP-dependent enzyme, partial [Sphingomicrobium sp.]
GAYGCAMRTQFNGFGAERTAIVEDEPMATLYGGRVARPNVMTL